jgi:hypothetical protein
MALRWKEFLRLGSLGQEYERTVSANALPLIKREKSTLSSLLLHRPGSGRVFDASSGVGDFL